MKHLSIFEEFKIKKSKKIYKHLDKGRGGVDTILSNIGDVDSIDDRSAISHVDILGDIMKSLTKRYGLKSNVKYMNSGVFGMAFVIGDKVIKLTSSTSESNIVRKMIGRKIPHCVNYYDIVFIKKYGIYAILMDRAEKLSEKEKKVINILSDSEFLLNQLPLLKRKVNKKGIDISDSKLIEIFNDYRDMYLTLKRNNIPTMDLHSGNVGYLKGKLVHFDIMDVTSSLADLRKGLKKISKFKIK